MAKRVATAGITAELAPSLAAGPPQFGLGRRVPVDWENQRPSVVGNPLLAHVCILQSRAGTTVNSRTKAPNYRAAGAGERSKPPRPVRVETSPVHLRGAFLVLSSEERALEHRHYPRKEGYGNAYKGFSSS